MIGELNLELKWELKGKLKWELKWTNDLYFMQTLP